jgi:adenylate cyclase
LFNGISYDFFRVPMRTSLDNIPYNHNDIRIELSSTNYLDNKVNYQYLLKGYDKIWSEWSNNPYIYLQNLKEGQYDLKIRSKNYLNETSDVTYLFFRIKPPFYRSWWAYLFYAISSGILLFMAYKTYLLNLHKAREITIKKDEEYYNPNRVPVIINNVDPATNGKKFDFFSNIDEDKVKDKTRWDKYAMVTVLFSDIQGFTKIAESMNPELLIDELDRFFFHFDSVVEKYNIEKIKTIGDAYMAAGGIPKKSITNPIEVVLAALEMQNYMKQLKKSKIDIWDLRIGIHSGPVIAGIIGHKKRSFDIWGDTVNTASRMESSGEPGKVNISSETYKFVKDYFLCDYRGKLPVKYKGNIDMYFVKGLRPELSINLVGLPNRKFFLKLQLLRLSDLEEVVFSKLEAELHKNLYFHNFEYAKRLYEHSSLLAKASELDLEETLLIRTSALLLNVGYTEGYVNQENRSAEYARNILPEYSYSEKQITVITNLILSTKWPPEPGNLLEMVLYDTKMDYVGRADYLRLYKLIFLEQNQYMKSVDVNEFKRKQLDIIRQYEFFTESARRLREISVEDQISKIKDDDWK